jgi:hypothetical protein
MAGVDVAEAEVPDQALLAQRGERLEAFGERLAVRGCHRPDAQVDEIESVHAQAVEVGFDKATHVGRGAVVEAIGADDGPDLGGDDQVGRVGVQGLANQGVRTHRTAVADVEVGGVDVVDPEFDGAPQHGTAGLRVAGGTAHTVLGGQPHGAEAKPVDVKVTAEAESVAHGRQPARPGISRRARGTLLPPAQWMHDTGRDASQ